MAQFPLLKTGAVAQYPSSREVSFGTQITKFLDGSEQRYPELPSAVVRWTIHLHAVDASEIAAIEDFFNSEQAEFGSFEFTDPWDGTVYADCSFEGAEFEARYLTRTRAAGRLVIRNNQV